MIHLVLTDQQGKSPRRPRYVPAWMRDRAQAATNARRRLVAAGVKKPVSPGTLGFQRSLDLAIQQFEERLEAQRLVEPPF